MSNPLAMKSNAISKSQLDSEVSLSVWKALKLRHKDYLKNPELIKRMIVENNIDVEFAASIMVPTYLLRDEHVLKLCTTGEHVASAKVEAANLRLRTSASSQLGNVIVEQLKQNVELCKEVVGKCRSSVFASCGAVGALGRYLKYAPRKGCMKGVLIPSVQEVNQAFLGCGIPNTREIVVEPYSITNEHGVDSIMVASKSGLGYPTLSKTDNVDAVSIHQQYAVEMLLKLQDVDDYDEAKKVLDADREAHPYKYIFVGKAKADLYKIDKVLADEMRWYCLVPFWIRAILMSVIQPLDAKSRNVISYNDEDERSVVHIASKMSFANGGAMKLVLTLQQHVDRFGYAYANNGDDTIIALRIGNVLVLVSVDMSSFDITQIAEIMQPLRRKMYERLQYIDPAAAYVYRYIKEGAKTIAAFSIGTFVMKHSSPSGMPGVSNENGLLANVVCQRIIAAWKKDENKFKGAGLEKKNDIKDWVSSIIDRVGRSLGLVARIDEFEMSSYERNFECKQGNVVLRGIPRILAEYPFLFLGYRLFGDANGAIICFQDLPRSLANLAYPNKMYIEDKTIFQLYDMMRILGSIINLGYYPKSYIGDSALFRSGCKHLPIVNGIMVPLMDIMKAFVRKYMDLHCRSLLDLMIPSSVTGSVNPFTGLEFEPTLRGMERVLDKECFYPLGDPLASLWGVGLYSFKDELNASDVSDFVNRVNPAALWAIDEPEIDLSDVMSMVSTMRPVKININVNEVKRGWRDPKADFFGKKPPLLGPVPTLKMIAGHTLRSFKMKGKITTKSQMHKTYTQGECDSVYDESVGQVDSEYFSKSEDGDFRDNWSEDSEENENDREDHRDWLKAKKIEHEEYFPNVNVN